MTATLENPYIDLLKRIERKDEKLSVSSFKEFAKSPKHFIKYKLKEKKQTDAMLKGSVMHCLILEPDEFDERYVVGPKPDRRTKVGKAQWAAILEEVEATGKEFVPQDMYDNAQRVKEYAYKNEAIRWVLDNLIITEQYVKWKLSGYEWHGFVDGIGEKFFVDLKGMADASPRKAKYTIRDMRYLWQGYLYSKSPECKGKDFYIVALEDMPNGCVIEIDQKTLQAQADEIDWYLHKFKMCTFENAWSRGYDYFTKNGIFNYSYL